MLKRLATWTLAALVAAEFCIAGASKFSASSTWTRMFANWGYPPWARLAVGAVEIACGVALLLPRARRLACGALGVVMVGAAATHLAHGEPRRILLNVVLAVLLGVLARIPAR
jgi:putative oxidoreductase